MLEIPLPASSFIYTKIFAKRKRIVRKLQSVKLYLLHFVTHVTAIKSCKSRKVINCQKIKLTPPSDTILLQSHKMQKWLCMNLLLNQLHSIRKLLSFVILWSKVFLGGVECNDSCQFSFGMRPSYVRYCLLASLRGVWSLAVDGLLQVTSSFSLKFFHFPRVNAGNCWWMSPWDRSTFPKSPFKTKVGSKPSN